MAASRQVQADARKRIERLLLNTLPEPVVREIAKQGGESVRHTPCEPYPEGALKCN